MNILYIINYSVMVTGYINFILSMLIILLISACFLGRYVMITRKVVLATLGTVAIQVLVYYGGLLLIYKINPALYGYMDGLAPFQDPAQDNPLYLNYMQFIKAERVLINGLTFAYAFIFYLVANKEKRIFRAIESTILLYLYYFYMNNIIQYTYLFLRGGKSELLIEVYRNSAGKEYVWMTTITIFAQFVINLVLLFILYFSYFKKRKFYNVRIRDRVLFIIWLVVFNLFPSIPFYGNTTEDSYRLLAYVFGALIPILGCIAPALLMMNAAERSLKEKNEYQETYLNAELEYIEQYKRTQEATRAFRHDIINKLALTNMMLDEGKTEEASEHLKQLLGNVKALSPSIITGDEMLDCIVAMKADKMREQAIKFTADGVVDGGLNMKPMDVCSIFANAFDNAIEASNKMVPDAWVDLNVKRTEKFFIIKISNSAVGKVDVDKLFMTAGYTSKQDKEHHGFGLRNIRNAVEEYNGLVKAESEDNVFALSIMIPRSE